MEYKETTPCIELVPFIHSFWEMKGGEHDRQWERNFPDGCPGLVINLGDTCVTDNGSVAMEFGKTYVVGTMTSFKDSFIDNSTHLLGVCLKPATFSNFYNYAAQNELTGSTIELDRKLSFDIDRIFQNPANYLNQFYTDRIRKQDNPLHSILKDIHNRKGQLTIDELAKRNYTTIRQLERNFKEHIGITPKEYSNVVRFQNAMRIIQSEGGKRSLLDIAFECGFYDHAHLANNIRRHTGLAPTQL
ncbi:helix-turn-helix domain-containing protein [Dyadobacter sp. CY312]|uniref:helix-turn-helix domain-containing protein n=1 Tax=Dyadobacter sp. CY312 TaxID=2907303 RepID=UPI001F3144AE|nr:helix-turn-helix domain-containing protein [Dyadobacter sp. CY312]MCE7044431.1 helix-turn-helix domain-containing protein [Dyadobacter sp. CY312]